MTLALVVLTVGDHVDRRSLRTSSISPFDQCLDFLFQLKALISQVSMVLVEMTMLVYVPSPRGIPHWFRPS